MGLMKASKGEVLRGRVHAAAGALSAPAELVLDDSPCRVQPVAQTRDVGGVGALEEWHPERGTGERCLDVGQQLVDRDLMVGVGAERAHEPLQRMAKVPFAEVHLSVGEPSMNGVRKARVVVAHDPRRGAIQGTEECLPIGLGLAREGLQPP
jgi:hypothetical protein